MDASTNGLSRRQFLKTSATVAASAAALSAIGCIPQSAGASEQGDVVKHEAPVNPEEGGTWVAAACWHNCGGRCMNKVMVKDGVVVRRKTDDTHEDTPEYPQQRGCVRGKAQQQQCFGADRILTPLKRKNWQPGGGENAHGELRGVDEWEAISWDEAIKYCADEIGRIRDEYGNAGIYSKSANAFMNGIGGVLTSWETQSFGTYSFDMEHFGLPSRDRGKANDRFDMKNADYVVMYSSNPTWSAAGTPTYYWIQAHEAGTQFVCVDPIYNATAQMLDAEWVPVRPGTDIAFLLGVAYEMLRLDEEEGDIIDWDFLDKYTVGFDAEHMPADATSDENMQGYILGEYDDTPKTPEWASEICGVPVEQITNFARTVSKQNNVMILHNYGMSRAHGTEQFPQMLMTIACMGGHYGKPGNACGGAYHADAGNYGPRLVSAGSATGSSLSNGVDLHPRTGDILEIIASGEGGTFSDVGGYGNTFHEPQDVTVGPIKCILHGYEASLQTSPHQLKNIEAHRAVDFVMSYATFMTTNAQYSDIILPLNTEWERAGSVESSNREFILVNSKVTESLGESKSDQEIGTLLLEGMGIDPSEAFPISEEQAFFEKVAGCTVMDDSGEMVPLVTITDDDIATLGVEGAAQEGIISYADIIANGGYQYQRSEGDGHGFIGYEDFITDPEANPLPSVSGKFEIYCQAHDDMLHMLNYPNNEAYKPYPTYVVPPMPVGYAATFKDGVVGGEKGDYPYLLFNPHYLRRSHTVFDNCPWLREAWPNPVFLSRADAEEKGIADGDPVLVSTYVGTTLRTAAIMDIMMPGVVGVPHGAWVDIDPESGVDRAGSDNLLIGNEYSGMGVTGYNNCTCNIEKYDGDALVADCDLPARWTQM